MSESKEPATGASIASLAIALTVSAACFCFWMKSQEIPYLLSGLGFLIWSPVWYRSPVPFAKLLFKPVGTRVTPRRQFSRFDGFCVLTGQLLILVAIVFALITWHRS